jgi:hypothetical protein
MCHAVSPRLEGALPCGSYRNGNSPLQGHGSIKFGLPLMSIDCRASSIRSYYEENKFLTQTCNILKSIM